MLEVLAVIYVIYAVWAIWLTIYLLERNKHRDGAMSEVLEKLEALNRIAARSQPREDYHKIVWGINPHHTKHQEIFYTIAPSAIALKRTIAFSFDDMVIGNLTNKSAVVFGCDDNEDYFRDYWFSKWGSDTQVRFVRYNAIPDFIAEMEAKIAERQEPI